MFDINISGHSLSNADFLDVVTAQIAETRVDGRQICFEITETSAGSELAHALRFMDELTALVAPPKFAITNVSGFPYDLAGVDGRVSRRRWGGRRAGLPFTTVRPEADVKWTGGQSDSGRSNAAPSGTADVGLEEQDEA